MKAIEVEFVTDQGPRTIVLRKIADGATGRHITVAELRADTLLVANAFTVLGVQDAQEDRYDFFVGARIALGRLLDGLRSLPEADHRRIADIRRQTQLALEYAELELEAKVAYAAYAAAWAGSDQGVRRVWRTVKRTWADYTALKRRLDNLAVLINRAATEARSRGFIEEAIKRNKFRQELAKAAGLPEPKPLTASESDGQLRKPDSYKNGNASSTLFGFPVEPTFYDNPLEELVEVQEAPAPDAPPPTIDDPRFFALDGAEVGFDFAKDDPIVAAYQIQQSEDGELKVTPLEGASIPAETLRELRAVLGR